MLMPTLQQADLWREFRPVNDDYGKEMPPCAVKDRHEPGNMLYGPTNEN